MMQAGRSRITMPSFPRTVMLLGSGELGKEVAIAAQRLGCRVIALSLIHI